ncbi:rhodanese-like domain-containing protein [Helicobacter sp. 23-1045]
MKKALNLGEFKQKMDSAIIIDVRARGYFLIDHIKDAINVESPTRIAFIAQENADKDIILYCHHGVTAGSIAEALSAKNVYFLDANFSDVVKSGIEIVFYSKN